MLKGPIVSHLSDNDMNNMIIAIGILIAKKFLNLDIMIVLAYYSNILKQQITYFHLLASNNL
ncbi:hypothetical protein LI82_08815 [Methanococcoides methylutens]|uniref:Uncharacterized protein n=1 Tax=Methanococcoides methylutens TaxID=2226 RepID=A0A099SY46_METMT|nr:hypothetical protein LI82_08815 [Methanococcoides methylutens]